MAAVTAAAGDEQLLVRADSLIRTGKLADARRLAERFEDRHPQDPRVLILLGRIYLAWPVVGRYRAESLLTRAGRMDSTNAEPFYLIAEVGTALRGEDGEEFVRRGLIGALGANPDYRDAWERWQRVYQRDSDRQKMVNALARHAGGRNADYRRAQLLVQMERSEEAAALFDSVVTRHPGDPGPLAWLARALFTAGRDSAGVIAYEAAIRLASDDTGLVLWKQIRGIATQGERDTFALTFPGSYTGFFRRFWARRDPELAAPVNRRFVEHFHRLAYATHRYPLQHGGSRYFQSEVYRALTGDLGLMPDPNGALTAAFDAANEAQGSVRTPSVRDEIIRAGLGPRIMNDVAANLEDNLDDRGRIYLRHGPPDTRHIGPHGDSETWFYGVAGGRSLRVSFMRRTAGVAGAGDMVLTAMAWGEAESARSLLDTDRSTATNTLDFVFWLASFRSGDGATELYVVADSVAGVAVLLDAEGREADRASGSGGRWRLATRAGRYTLMLDAERDGKQAHYRGGAALPDLGGGRLAVSTILVATGTPVPQRDSMLAALSPRLEISADQPLRVYAEIYGLGRDSGVSRYSVDYRFERTDGEISEGGRSSSIAFERQHVSATRIVESLIVDPDRLPKGRYRLNLVIFDRVRGVQVSSGGLLFRLR